MHTNKESMLWSICRTIADNCSWIVLPNRETDGIWILAFDSGLKVMNLDQLIDMLWTYVMDRYMQIAKQAISKRVKKFVVTFFEGGYNWAKSSTPLYITYVLSNNVTNCFLIVIEGPEL